MAGKRGNPKNGAKRSKFSSSSSSSSFLLWERLPDEMWEQIFTHLPFRCNRSISLVCKRFLALSNRAITTIFISSRDKPFPLLPLFSRFTFIKTINFGYDPNLDASITLLAKSRLPLQTLILDYQVRFPREAMRLLGRRMKRTLRSLSCTYFQVMNDQDITVVADFFRYLQHLDISGRPSIKFRNLTDKSIWKISTKLKSLVSLKIIYGGCFTHLSLECLASYCPLLRNLCACVDYFEDFFSLDKLDRFDYFKSLSSLQLRGVKISGKVFDQLSRVGLQLQELELEYPQCSVDVTGSLFCEFLKSCRSLRRLHLSPFSFPGDTNAFDFADSLPNIRVIHLFSCRTGHLIPPTTLLHLLNSCPHLEDIHIACNSLGITLNWFNGALSDPCPVRRMNLSYCDDLCDETLKLLVSCCPKLESLSIIRCSKITHGGVDTVLRNPSIRLRKV